MYRLAELCFTCVSSTAIMAATFNRWLWERIAIKMYEIMQTYIFEHLTIAIITQIGVLA